MAGAGNMPVCVRSRITTHCIRKTDRHSRADAKRSKVPRVGVPTLARKRRVQDQETRYLGGSGESCIHVIAMFEVWVHPREESPRRVVRVPAIGMCEPRGLQRLEEYWTETLW